MNVEPDVARLARTIGDPTRIRMLTLLMEGRALTAKELSYGVGVEPATATAHLQKLLADSLVASRTQGRHKYFRLASPEVARCVESMMALAPPVKSSEQALSPICVARFCYDHLAGRVATVITQNLIRRKLLLAEEDGYALTARGTRWFIEFGVDLAALENSRRRYAYACLDWSERKDHLGGALGAAFAARTVALGWVKRKRDSRIAIITPSGQKALAKEFGVAGLQNAASDFRSSPRRTEYQRR